MGTADIRIYRVLTYFGFRENGISFLYGNFHLIEISFVFYRGKALSPLAEVELLFDVGIFLFWELFFRVGMSYAYEYRNHI